MFVESVTYRRDAHTTAGDPSRYRDPSEVEAWEERDPIDRYRGYLEAEGIWTEIDAESLRASIDEEFDEALELANGFEPRDVDSIFDHLYDQLPPSLERQAASLREHLESMPGAGQHIEQRPKG